VCDLVCLSVCDTCQACRGRRYDAGVDVMDDVTDDVLDAAGLSSNVRRIPVEADVLLAYSVVPGTYVLQLTSCYLHIHCVSLTVPGQVYLLTPMDRATLPYTKSTISCCTPSVISRQQVLQAIFKAHYHSSMYVCHYVHVDGHAILAHL